MAQFTVDATVAVKWFAPEKDSELAHLLVAEGNKLTARDIVVAEIAAGP
jgi:predicted nucleic acid-binding protein